MKGSTQFLMALAGLSILLFGTLALAEGPPNDPPRRDPPPGHVRPDPVLVFEEFDPVKDGNIVVWFENAQRKRYALRVVAGQKIRVYTNTKRLDFFHGDSYRRIFFNPVEVEIGKTINARNFTGVRKR